MTRGRIMQGSGRFRTNPHTLKPGLLNNRTPIAVAVAEFWQRASEVYK